MATITKALLDLLNNPKTQNFAKSLKHSDLPTGWADDPEIVDLAAKAWQEAGTGSPFFKAWFGGSKAVGKDKAPSKYYHATTKDFDIFDAPAIESGYHARPAGLAFFTDKPSVADTYVRKEMLNAFSPEKWEDGANMMEVFLNLEKPIKINARGSYWNDIPYKDDYLQTNDLGALAKESAKNDGVIIKNVRDEGRGRDWKNAEPLKSTVAITTNPTQIKSTFNRGTFDSSDPNIMRTLAPLGVGTAAMAAALLGDGSEAEAAPKMPVGIQKLVRELGEKRPRGVDLGPMQDDIFTALQGRNDAYQLPELFASANDIRHLQKSRMEKPRASQKMTPEEIGDMVNSLQNSTRARVVTGKDAYPDAVIVPHGEQTYLGVYRPEDDGRAGLQTAYAPKTRALPNKLGSAKNPQTTFRDWVDANLPSNYAPATGREFTQRQLSAVEPLQVAAEEKLPEVASSVNKKIIPAALLAAALGGDAARATAIEAALADPASREKAAAAGLPYDPPPTEPVVSPIDILVAPVGAGAGITNKLLAMALEAPVALGLDAGLSALGGLFWGDERKKPGGW